MSSSEAPAQRPAGTPAPRSELRTHQSPVRFGVLGCGGIGRWHARTIRSLAGLELTAVADPDPAARARAARDFGVPALADAAALLARDDVDVVSICTPPDSHAPLIEAAAAAGKHVLVEKPLASRLADADRAIAACAARGVVLAVAHQQRGRSATRLLARLVHEGRVGEPLVAAVTHTWFASAASSRGAGWRADAARGGGLLLDQLVHGADLLVWLLGEPLWVSGATAHLALGPGAEDTAAATVGFRRGALATIAGSAAANRDRDDIVLEIAGTQGGARLEIRDYDNAELVALHLGDALGGRARALDEREIEALVRGEEGGWRGGPRSPLWRLASRLAGAGRERPFRSPLAYLRRRADRAAQLERDEPQGHAAVLARMAAAVRGEVPPLVSGREARAALALVEAIRASAAAGGGRVGVPPPAVAGDRATAPATTAIGRDHTAPHSGYAQDAEPAT